MRLEHRVARATSVASTVPSSGRQASSRCRAGRARQPPVRSASQVEPPPATSSRTTPAATAPAVPPVSASSAILRWNSRATWSSVAPMPCITSIVERWVSSAPRAASTTAAAVASAISSDQRHGQPAQRAERAEHRRRAMSRWATKRAPGTARSTRAAIGAGSGAGREVDVDQRRQRQVAPRAPAGPSQRSSDRRASRPRGPGGPRRRPGAARASGAAPRRLGGAVGDLDRIAVLDARPRPAAPHWPSARPAAAITTMTNIMIAIT